MGRYYDRYDEMGEPRSILSGPRLKRALEMSLELPEPSDEERFMPQALEIIEKEHDDAAFARAIARAVRERR